MAALNGPLSLLWDAGSCCVPGAGEDLMTFQGEVAVNSYPNGGGNSGSLSCPEPVKLVTSAHLAALLQGDAPQVEAAALGLPVPLVPFHREDD